MCLITNRSELCLDSYIYINHSSNTTRRSSAPSGADRFYQAEVGRTNDGSPTRQTCWTAHASSVTWSVRGQAFGHEAKTHGHGSVGIGRPRARAPAIERRSSPGDVARRGAAASDDAQRPGSGGAEASRARSDGCRFPVDAARAAGLP